MKRILYKIQDRIATRFLEREIDKEGAGKGLAIYYHVMLKQIIDNEGTAMILTYEQEYKGKKYNIKSEITITERL